MECLHPPSLLRPPRREITGTQALASASELLRGTGKHGSRTDETKSTSSGRSRIGGWRGMVLGLVLEAWNGGICAMHVGYENMMQRKNKRICKLNFRANGDQTWRKKQIQRRNVNDRPCSCFRQLTLRSFSESSRT